MYERHFGFRALPFALAPDPAFLYPSREHRRAITALDYAVLHGAGFALVTGEIGSGKTTLIRHLLARSQRTLTIALLGSAQVGSGQMLAWIAQSLGLAVPPAAGDVLLHERILQFALAEYAAGRHVLLVVDEAQNMSAAGLEELRLLSNINSAGSLLIQTILVGQPELRRTLRRDDLRQFAQRIGVEYHLGTLPPDEVREYVRHRLAVAGGSPDVISDEAIELLQVPAGGVPRLINLLCDTALVYGFADQVDRVGAEIMAQVLQERMDGGVLPLNRPDRGRAAASMGR